MRGYEQAGAIALRPTDEIDHGADGALAVCAGDVDDFGCKALAAASAWRLNKRRYNIIEQPLDIFETQFDPEALEAVKPGERLLVIQTCARCHIHRVAAK